MSRTTASACPPRLAEAADLSRNAQAENIRVPPNEENPVVNALLKRIEDLEKEVKDLKARLGEVHNEVITNVKDIKTDVESLWSNSDLAFKNDKKLWEKLHGIKRDGPVNESRKDRLISRLRNTGNKWIAKADLKGWFEMKTRQATHWLWLSLSNDPRFEVHKEFQGRRYRCYIRLRPFAQP